MDKSPCSEAAASSPAAASGLAPAAGHGGHAVQPTQWHCRVLGPRTRIFFSVFSNPPARGVYNPPAVPSGAAQGAHYPAGTRGDIQAVTVTVAVRVTDETDLDSLQCPARAAARRHRANDSKLAGRSGRGRGGGGCGQSRLPPGPLSRALKPPTDMDAILVKLAIMTEA